MNEFWNFIESYAGLSAGSKEAWSAILKESQVPKGRFLLDAGVVPRDIFFVKSGLLSYECVNEKGVKVIKKFFPENSLVASTSAMLKHEPGHFAIQALEDCQVISYSFQGFRALTERFNDVAAFYIRYMEKHWVIEKEFEEITLKSETAKQRYEHFEKQHPDLIPRLKLHHIASYLAITPTQLSRIRAEL
ncbi:MAG TPA: Crp/Fnr family transcriptional regulator [Dyadobacter sp.]|nr:Crp/Fnr family transcriptional regulator [Dyadobacter sp.]